jgi:hypothetical protein
VRLEYLMLHYHKIASSHYLTLFLACDVNQNNHTGDLAKHKGNFFARRWLLNACRALNTVLAWSRLSHNSRDCDR